MRRDYKTIPKTLMVEGKKYKLESYEAKDGSFIDGWWLMVYRPVNKSDGNNMPPTRNNINGVGSYYLCVATPTKEESERTMLEKLRGEW